MARAGVAGKHPFSPPGSAGLWAPSQPGLGGGGRPNGMDSSGAGRVEVKKVVARRRPRWAYLGWIVVVIGAGLMLRSGKAPLPGWVIKYGGDALWALVVFLCLGVARPSGSTRCLGWIALVVSWGVEFLQLYHAPWIDGIRATLMGRLVLGSSFNAPDLVAYGVGILGGMGAERLPFGRGRGRAA